MDATAAARPVSYGGFWIRVVAFLLDGLVIGVITSAAAPFMGAGPMFEGGGTVGGVSVNYGTNALGGLVGLLYFVGFWSLRGQTVGMIPFRLHVVRVSDGSKPDWVVSLLRYVGLIISFAVILIGVIWVAFDGRKQGWHDKMASTLVARDPA